MQGVSPIDKLTTLSPLVPFLPLQDQPWDPPPWGLFSCGSGDKLIVHATYFHICSVAVDCCLTSAAFLA